MHVYWVLDLGYPAVAEAFYQTMELMVFDMHTSSRAPYISSCPALVGSFINQDESDSDGDEGGQGGLDVERRSQKGGQGGPQHDYSAEGRSAAWTL